MDNDTKKRAAHFNKIRMLIDKGRPLAALRLFETLPPLPPKEAASSHMVLNDAVDQATTSGAASVLKVLQKQNIVTDKADVEEMQSDLRAMLQKWLKSYLKNVMKE